MIRDSCASWKGKDFSVWVVTCGPGNLVAFLDELEMHESILSIIWVGDHTYHVVVFDPGL